MRTLRTLDTEHHTYYLSYWMIAKTSLEQQREYKEKFLYMMFQKALGSLIIILSILPVIIFNEPAILLFSGIFILLGVVLLFTDEYAIG